MKTQKSPPRVAIVAQESFDNKGQESWAIGALVAAVHRAVKKGYVEFYCVCNPGPEMEAAKEVLKLGASLVITHPYEGYGEKWRVWTSSQLDELEELDKEAKRKHTTDHEKYINGTRSQWDKGVHSAAKIGECYEWMVEECDVVIAAHSEKLVGAVGYALSYASVILDKPIYLANPLSKETEWILPQE